MLTSLDKIALYLVRTFQNSIQRVASVTPTSEVRTTIFWLGEQTYGHTGMVTISLFSL